MRVPDDALVDPFIYLPAPVLFTEEMAALLKRSKDSARIEPRHYRAHQAAAYLRPKTVEQHADRREQFLALKGSAESQGFKVPETLTRLFMTDEYIDRLHCNCVWPRLPEAIIRLPSNPEFALFLFLTESQACVVWHLLLAPDGSHTIITADEPFGCYRGYPPGFTPNPAKFSVFQCIGSLNELLFRYFIASAYDDSNYLKWLAEYSSETNSK